MQTVTRKNTKSTTQKVRIIYSWWLASKLLSLSRQCLVPVLLFYVSVFLAIASLTVTLSLLCLVDVSFWYCSRHIPFYFVCCKKDYQYCNHGEIFMYQVYNNLAYVPPKCRRVKQIRVISINKNLRKALASRNGNGIFIWSWNNPSQSSFVSKYYFEKNTPINVCYIW